MGGVIVCRCGQLAHKLLLDHSSKVSCQASKQLCCVGYQSSVEWNTSENLFHTIYIVGLLIQIFDYFPICTCKTYLSVLIYNPSIFSYLKSFEYQIFKHNI